MDLTPPAAEQSRRPPTDSVLRWLSKELAITLAQSAVLAIALQLVLVSFGTAAYPIGTWAVGAVAILAIRLHRTAMPVSARKRAKARSRTSAIDARNERLAESLIAPRSSPRVEEQWFDPLPPTLERRFARMYRHVDRLSFAVVAPRHFDSGVRPVLAELARDRVRRHHGIELTDSPANARAVLGEDLWQALTEPLEAAPTAVDLDRWVTRLERLDPARTPSTGRA